MGASPATPARTPAELRKAALQLAAFFAVIGGVSWWRRHVYPPLVLWSAAALLAVLALVAPTAFGPIERVLIRAGERIGRVTSPIVLGIVYYLVLTPFGIVMRRRRDPLDRRMHDGTPSNWIKRSGRSSAESYRQQF